MATYTRLTRYSPLNFSLFTGTLPTTLDPSGFEAAAITTIKNKFLRRTDCSSVVLIEGDAFKLYLPLIPDYFSTTAIAGDTIRICDENGTVLDNNAGTIQGTAPSYYIDITVPAIEQDRCFLALWNGSAYTAVSGYIDFVASSYDVDYPFFKWRNSYNFFGHYWEEFLDSVPTFYNQLRLDVNQKDAQFQDTIEQEKGALDGTIIDLVNDTEKYIVVETYQFDEDTHEGAAVMFKSDQLFINDQQYVKKTGYQAATPGLINLTNGSVELYDLDFATASYSMSV